MSNTQGDIGVALMITGGILGPMPGVLTAIALGAPLWTQWALLGICAALIIVGLIMELTS